MSEKRDYSEVTFPWDDDPNWGAPREGATSNPGDGENWRLACKQCRLYFPDDIQMHVVRAHFDELHGGEDSKLELNLVWVGLGTPPQPPDGMLL